MKRDEKKMIFCEKNVSEPSNLSDEFAQNVSKKNPFRTNYSSCFSFHSSESYCVFNYLHDSSSIFRAVRKNRYFRAAR